MVAAAGNNGKDTLGRKVYGQIHSPGNSPAAITVGAAILTALIRAPMMQSPVIRRAVRRAVTTPLLGVKKYDNLIKPDIVAPGNKMISAMSPNNVIRASNLTLSKFNAR